MRAPTYGHDHGSPSQLRGIPSLEVPGRFWRGELRRRSHTYRWPERAPGSHDSSTNQVVWQDMSVNGVGGSICVLTQDKAAS